MKFFFQLFGLLIIAAGASAITYFVKGEPQRYLVLDPAIEILPKEGEISLQMVMSENPDVLWIDARTRNEWNADGVIGSLFISSDPREDIDQLIENNMERLFKASQSETLVVVYCNQIECVDSKNVIDSIRAAGFELNIYRLLGGYSSLHLESKVPKK